MFLWYDEANDNFVELDTVLDEENSTASVVTEHFSRYLLVDSEAWFLGWKEVYDKIVVIDAGHGGNDVGTGDESYWEKDLNMDIVLKMKDMLSYCGVNVLLTRDGDETLALDERSAFANEHEEADYFVSVHCNYCEDDASVRGLECYYWEGSEQGKNYAQSIIDTVALEDKIIVRGIKTDNFHVLRETKMPAILIETGYLSNAEEKKNLYDDTYQKTVALFLVKGIISGALD